MSKQICITRPREKNSLYKMVQHKESKRNQNRNQVLLTSLRRLELDGLNNLEYLNVSIVDEKITPIFVRLKVSIGQSSNFKFSGINSFEY